MAGMRTALLLLALLPLGAQADEKLWQDPRVRESLTFTLSFTAISVAIQVVMALGIAELLNRRFRGRNIVRAINLLPWAISGIVIGTAGTSPFGAYGYNPEGVRIGQKESRHQRAVKVWDKREFKNLDDTVEIGTRNLKVALRRLRKWARDGAEEEGRGAKL